MIAVQPRVGRPYAPDWSGTPADPDAWKADGLCRQVDPDMWFPEKGGSTRTAKRLCGECTVAAECLAYALEHDERYGIWGGKSELDRQKLRAPAGPKSRAPHRHPGPAVNPVKFPCSCGLSGCKGLVSESTLARHAGQARQLAAQVAA